MKFSDLKITNNRLQLFLSLLFCSALCVLMSSPSLANTSTSIPLSLLQGEGKINLSFHTKYLVDTQHKLNQYEAIEEISGLGRNIEKSVNFGFVEPTYWFLNEVHNDTRLDKTVYLEIGYPLLDEVDFYLYDTTQNSFIKHSQTGDKHTFYHREMAHPHFVFPITLEENQSVKVLIKVRTGSAMQVPITLWEPITFGGYSQSNAIFFGSVVGIIAIMALYNLFLFFSIRDNSYLYFSICLMGYVVVETSLTGLSYQYFWPENIFLQEKSLIVSAFLALSALILFARDFLSLKTSMPRAYHGFTAIAGIGLLGTIAAFIFPYQTMVQAAIYYVAISPLSGYIAGIYLWRTGFQPARYYTVAFSAFVLSVLVLSLAKFGFIPTAQITEYSVHFGAISVVALLSFALAERINREREAKEDAQEFAIENLEKFRDLYENSLEGMFQLTPSGKLNSANPAFAKLLGAESINDLHDQVGNLKNLIPADRHTFRQMARILNQDQKIFGYEALCRRLDGTEFWATIFARLINLGGKEQVVEGSIIDITDRKKSENQLRFLAKHDSLTGLLNRAEFETRMKRALENSRSDGVHSALMFIDLDQFKVVNDTSGHSAGDELLKQLADLFHASKRDRDALARLGGDEFAILLERCSLNKAEEIANRLRNEVSDFRFSWDEKTFSVGASIGIVPINESSPTIEEVFSLADTACYAAKDAGRNCVMVHSPTSNIVTQRQSEMHVVATLKEAIKTDQLVLYKQRISAIESLDEGDRYEILVRMKKGEELIPPGAFLPAAERYNAIIQLDKWVVENYFRWLDQNPLAKAQLAQVSINLSGQTLGDSEFAEYLESVFDKYTVPTEKVCFEITESTAVKSLGDTNAFIKRLKLRGVKFSLDDFGSGFSSYSYLKNLQVDSVKIDGSFVRDINHDNIDLAMVRSIADVAKAIGIHTVAEFVEDQAILNKLTELGVDFAQGYHIHKPSPLDDDNLANEACA